MDKIQEGTLLWEPNEDYKEQTALNDYMKWLKNNKQIYVDNYNDLWKWSVNEVESFWESLWEYFDVQSKDPYQTILTTHEMPGAKWFPEATINYTEHIFKKFADQKTAIIHATENRKKTETTWNELYQDTVNMQQTLKNLGVKKGDRIIAYVANIYETIVAFLATASLGAVWSSASPDFGTQSVIDRFKQIEPKVMITVDGYTYGGKAFDRTDTIEDIQAELPTLEATIVIPFLSENPRVDGFRNPMLYEKAIREKHHELTYEYVEFNDPLWILFSSGTTGVPKPIVHSQGGILLEHFKALTFHHDLTKKDRFFWYTTTGWMMWNFVVGALLTKSSIILYDGSQIYPHIDKMNEVA